jgi:hypothetical protein
MVKPPCSSLPRTIRHEGFMKMNKPLRRGCDQRQGKKNLRRNTLKDQPCSVLKPEPPVIPRMPHQAAA